MICTDREALTLAAGLFHERARRLRRSAWAILFTILAVLAAGIAIFILAGELANREAQSALVEARKGAVNVIEARLKEVRREIMYNQKERFEYEQSLRDEMRGAGGRTAGPGTNARFWIEQLDQSRRREGDLSGSLYQLFDAQKAAQEQLAAAIATPHDAQLSTLISAVVTRAGTIILLLFLVQILVPLYKYNIRLAAFYDARGDALAVMDAASPPETEDVERIVAAFSPDSLGFEKPPATPTQQAIELARHVLSVRK
jgi:hypothetical protein